MDVFFNYATLPAKQIVLNASSTGAMWDVDEWDEGRWAGSQVTNHRVRMAKKGREWMVRIRNAQVDANLIVHKIAMSGELLTDQNHAD